MSVFPAEFRFYPRTEDPAGFDTIKYPEENTMMLTPLPVPSR
jgi:hypothetical protein